MAMCGLFLSSEEIKLAERDGIFAVLGRGKDAQAPLIGNVGLRKGDKEGLVDVVET